MFNKLGKFLTNEQREKISLAMMGNNNFVKNFDEERRKKFSERMKQSHKDNPRIIIRNERGRIIGTKSGKSE
jgi:hypothetical protein